jgi:hypothetical protein
MSAKKFHAAALGRPDLTVQSRQTRLSLSTDSVLIHRGGIEFRSQEPFSTWTELTVDLQSMNRNTRVHATGVVISCTGNRHTGYHVSVVFTSLSRQAQEKLQSLAWVNGLPG